MKKRLMLYIVAINILIIAVAATTFAWFTTAKRTGNLRFQFGSVEYTIVNVNDAFEIKNLIVPGDELVNTPLVLANTSTITTELRVQISLDYQVNGYNVSHNVGEDGMFEIDMPEEWSYVDNYWYYVGSDNSSKIETTQTNIELINSLKLNGTRAGDNIKGKNMKLNIVFQAKQGTNVTWDMLGEADFALN